MGLAYIERRTPADQLTSLGLFVLAAIVVVGAVLRFWGLGNLSLYGDEELMGMATRGLVETGSPVLPSGMEYFRAFPQLLLTSLSTDIFGDTEWALRLPSAVIGTIGIVIAYMLGRRFLSVNLSIIFALIVALLPIMIALSQTARMYGFYVTFVMLFAIAVIRWERSQSVWDYVLAIMTCLACISFHGLAVFSMFLFFYPGFTRSSVWMFVAGGFAFAVCVGTYLALDAWIDSHYFELVGIPETPASLVDNELVFGLSPGVLLVGVLVVGAIAAGGFQFARRNEKVRTDLFPISIAAACLASALIVAILGQFHLSAILFAVGSVLMVRSQVGFTIPLTVGVLLFLSLVVQAAIGWQSGQVTGLNELILLLVGTPSAWPYLIFARFAPLAVAAYGVFLIFQLIRFANGRELPDHVLFFLVAVFAPLFMIGFFGGYIASRYLVGFLPFFVLAAIAAAQVVIGSSGAEQGAGSLARLATATIVLLAFFVSPGDLLVNTNPRSADFSRLYENRGVDHRGAAEFIKAQGLTDDDVVIAVDAQQQSYYLGDRLDFYLRSLNSRRNSSILRNGMMLNLYTGTPQIATGAELANLMASRRRGDVYIIGSGEIEKNPARSLGDGILETMEEFDLEEVYTGEDKVTKIWRFSASKVSAPSATEST